MSVKTGEERRKGQELSNGDSSGTEPGVPRLRVPEEYRNGLGKLIELEDEPFRELLVALEKERPTLYYYEFSDRVASKVSAVAANDVRAIVETLGSLYDVLPEEDSRKSVFIDRLVEAIERSEDADLNLSGKDRGRFRDRLIQLLNIDALDATSKALDVLLEHEHTLHDARTLTDIRPIFRSSTEDPPEAMMIIHQLKISYHDESEEVKEFYVALDTRDVSALIETLERARSKAGSLRRIIEQTGIPYIDTEGGG